jgi:DNA-binding transcriptional ArsR family regulator
MNAPSTAPAPTAPATSAVASERGLQLVDEMGRAVLLVDPERRRLVDALRDEPDSATGLARRLGDTRQRLNYHLRVLEDAGLVELHEERLRGNCTERVLRVAARRFVVDPGAVGDLPAEPRDAGDGFSATYFVAVAARAIREVVGLKARAEAEGKRLATATLDLRVSLGSPRDFKALVDDLACAVAEVAARHHRDVPGARPYRILAGLHPAPADPQSADPESADPESADPASAEPPPAEPEEEER